MRIVSGSSANVIYFVGLSTSDHFSRVSDLGTFDVTYSLNGSTGSTVHNMTVAAANSTKMPGVYKLNMLDSTVTSIPAGMDSAELCLHITSSMDPVTRTVEIFRRAVTTGQTIAINSSGKIADVESILSKVTSIESNTTGMVTKLSSIEANTTLLVTRLTSVETDVDSVLTKVTSIDTNTTALVILATSINTHVNAVQAQTTQLAFTQAGKVDANIHYVNNVQVQGVGTTTNTWRPV